jgi:uncharacterized membrane protein
MQEPAPQRSAVDLSAAAARRLTLAGLGWFVGPYALLVSTAAVLVAMWRRQFSSDARAALGEHP